MTNLRCHKCNGSMDGTTATHQGQWTCPKCLYELETGREAKAAPKKQKSLVQRGS